MKRTVSTHHASGSPGSARALAARAAGACRDTLRAVDVVAYRRAEAAYWAAVGVAPQEEWLEVGSGGRLRVQVVGEGPPVLFLHGVNTSGTVWAPLAARLPGFRCLLVDRPGCGLSDPAAARHDDVAAFGSALLRHGRSSTGSPAPA